MKLAIAVLVACSVASPAAAHHRKRHPEPSPLADLAGSIKGALARFASAAATAGSAIPEALQAASVGRGEVEVVPNVPGCPPTKFCGCAVSAKVYGHPADDPKGLGWNLYTADNWPKHFPRAACAPGNILHISGHVAYILECQGDQAKLWDPNSGGHLTRVHWVSVGRAEIVAPVM